MEYCGNWRYALLCLGVTGEDATAETLQENNQNTVVTGDTKNCHGILPYFLYS